ncbi:MAG: protoheme IX farnesyltransferase [Planktomarina sp.]|nr:protoheme IX farnesyltransferase [Planktomarina sp.]
MTYLNDHNTGYDPVFSDYIALLKPRVMSLVVFTAFVGLMAAPISMHPIEIFCVVLFVALGAGASGSLNMWWDSDIDAIMFRTKMRPIPSGRTSRDAALGIGVALSGLSVLMLGLASNWHAAGWLAFTIFFYVVVYTIWLKRTTPQNIVIGGAAGAFPPLIGWVAATGSISIESILMFALIFMWTPAHFWALALFMHSDYEDAKVPMLTVTHGRRSTRRHIMAYAAFQSLLAVGLAFSAVGGPTYLVIALILNSLMLRNAFLILLRNEIEAQKDNFKFERSFFKMSLVYLFLHFLAILGEALLLPYGIGGW